MNAEPAKFHVLVVDDDRLVLATLAKGLRQAGYRVSEADSSSEALRLVKETRADLALLDVRMPGGSGLELAQQLSKAHRMPFLFLSAYGDEDIVKQAADFGALGYLVKPLDVSQIVPAIEAARARALEIQRLRETETQLVTALESGRETSMAVGLLMERNRLDREQAFELLRARARSSRRPVQEVAKELLDACEKLSVNGGP